MHKLKNKHTGEVITTPYMAEVEEYLNSGDYEMSDKYPYIGESKLIGTKVIFSGAGDGVVIDGEHYEIGRRRNNWSEPAFNEITREYLTNTYGKCESKEHADFICELAENSGFTPENDYHAEKGRVWFSFNHETGSFFEERAAKDDNEKLIHIPLPPKEKPMEETKPTYTKEMHERGELPAIGSKVKYLSCKGEVVVNKPDESGVIVVLDSHYNEYKMIALSAIKPIPTIEDDLREWLDGYIDWPESAGEYISEFLTRFNITPKDS